MGWRKNLVDFLIFFSVIIAVMLLVQYKLNIASMIFVLFGLTLSLFRRTVYDILG